MFVSNLKIIEEETSAQSLRANAASEAISLLRHCEEAERREADVATSRIAFEGCHAGKSALSMTIDTQ